MRKRQDLDGRISSVLRLEQTIEDNVGLIELGELEGDQGVVTEAEKALSKLKAEVAEQELETFSRAKPMAMTVMFKSTLVPVARKARTGPPS